MQHGGLAGRFRISSGFQCSFIKAKVVFAFDRDEIEGPAILMVVESKTNASKFDTLNVIEMQSELNSRKYSAIVGIPIAYQNAFDGIDAELFRSAQDRLIVFIEVDDTEIFQTGLFRHLLKKVAMVCCIIFQVPHECRGSG